MRIKQHLLPVFVGFCAICALSVVAQEEAEEQGVPTMMDDEDFDAETVVVVGTRLSTGDPSARVNIITRAEIEARGLTTAEEIVRGIPQNFSTINSHTNLDPDNGVLDTNTGALGLGLSTANLRGFGSANTLVLVNGQRVASAAGEEDLFANIRHIPAAAIERVEVHLDGGSAIFGSDAVGGTINFVLRKDYVGFGLTARMENSSTGGDLRRLSAFGGFGWDFGWGSGNATLAAAFTEQDPVLYAKTGYTTKDHSPKYGGNLAYNFINPAYCNTRSGRVGLSRWDPQIRILPPGNDGRNAYPDDFGTVVLEDCLDEVPKDSGGTTEDRSFTLNVHQTVGDRLTLRAEVIVSESSTAARLSTFGVSAILVPESNAFNNFGHDVYVDYSADTEAELGLIPDSKQTDDSDLMQAVLGFNWAVTPRLDLIVNYNTSESGGSSDQLMFSPASPRQDAPAVVAELTRLLASDDPNVAVNFFGDGSGQNPTIAEYYKSFASDNNRSLTKSLELYLTGDVIEVPAGEVSIVIGGERREESIEEVGEDTELEFFLGVPAPTRDLTSVYMELYIPIIDDGGVGIRAFGVTAQVRYDDYGTEGAVGRDAAGEPDLQRVSFDNISPRLGLSWQIIDELSLRLSHSEAFKTPVFSDLFSTSEFSEFFDDVYDPLAPSLFVPAILSYGPNPDLKPETSTNLTVGLDWVASAVPGLIVKLDWSKIDFQDRIAASYELGQLLPVEVYGNLPQFFKRRPDGTLIESISTSINIARRVNTAVDLDVSYAFATDLGSFLAELNYHRVLEMWDQAVPGAGKFTFVGESVGIDRYKAKGHLRWSRDAYNVDLWFNYLPGYVNNEFENTFRNIPNEDVDPHLTVDLTGGWTMDNGVKIRAGGRNIFDQDFPYKLSSTGRPYDAKRVDSRKRVLFIEASYDFEIR